MKGLYILPLLLTLGILSCKNETGKMPEIVYHEFHYDREYIDFYRIFAAYRFAEIPDLPPASRRIIQDLFFDGMDYERYAEKMLDYLGENFIDRSQYRFGFGNDFYDDPECEKMDNERWSADLEDYLFAYKIISESSDIVFSSSDFVVLQIEWSDTPSDAAHGLYGKIYQTADLKNGKIIQLEDVLPPQSLADLDGLMRSLLHEQGIYPEKFYPDMLPAPDSFIFEKQGLRLLWEPYSIASYSRGIVSISMPYRKIQSSLAEDGKRLAKSVR